jgi:hypothetical protein
LIRFDSLGLSVVTEQNAMTQNIVHNGLNIVRQNIISPSQPCIGTRAFIEADGAGRTGSDLNLYTQVLVVALRIASGFNESDNVVLNCFSHLNFGGSSIDLVREDEVVEDRSAEI